MICNCDFLVIITCFKGIIPLDSHNWSTYLLYNNMSGFQISLDGTLIEVTPPNSCGSHFKLSAIQVWMIKHG